MSYRYPFPYVSGTLLVTVGGTVQAAIDVDPDDPAGGTFDLPDDPEDMTVRAYAQISPDVIPAPVTPEGEEDEDAILVDEDDDYEPDEPLVDAEDDEEEEDDPDAPELPDELMPFDTHSHDTMHHGLVPPDQLAAGTPEHGDVPMWDEYGEEVVWGPQSGEGGGPHSHDAEDIEFTPAGTIAASNVQGAIEEAASDAASALSSHAADPDAHHPPGGDPSADTLVWMPLTTVIDGVVSLVHDEPSFSLIPTLVPLETP